MATESPIPQAAKPRDGQDRQRLTREAEGLDVGKVYHALRFLHSLPNHTFYRHSNRFLLKLFAPSGAALKASKNLFNTKNETSSRRLVQVLPTQRFIDPERGNKWQVV